jgi:hypothetical protein
LSGTPERIAYVSVGGPRRAWRRTSVNLDVFQLARVELEHFVDVVRLEGTPERLDIELIVCFRGHAHSLCRITTQRPLPKSLSLQREPRPATNLGLPCHEDDEIVVARRRLFAMAGVDDDVGKAARSSSSKVSFLK